MIILLELDDELSLPISKKKIQIIRLPYINMNVYVKLPSISLENVGVGYKV
jgi:hypothetical protein